MPEHAVQLRHAEERREESEARARELEKQVRYILFAVLIFLLVRLVLCIYRREKIAILNCFKQ